MGVTVKQQRPREVTVRTWNDFESNTYRLTVYEEPDGTKVVTDDPPTATVREALEESDYELRDEKPDRYRWYGPFLLDDGYDGVFTATGIEGELERDVKRYATDVGDPVHTSTKLEVGETYEVYRKDAWHFGFRTVD